MSTIKKQPTVYLFDAPDYDDGNAVCVIAFDDASAVKLAAEHCDGFEPSILLARKRKLNEQPIVVLADGYYRPRLTFFDQQCEPVNESTIQEQQ
jgi:hypothetical protein